MTDASPLPSPAERLGRPVEPSSTPHGTVSLILRFTVVALVMIAIAAVLGEVVERGLRMVVLMVEP